MAVGNVGKYSEDDMAGRMYRAIGVISGTSMDAIDVAMIETDGDRQVTTGRGIGTPYPAEVRAELGNLVADRQRAAGDPAGDLERKVTAAHIAAIEAFMRAEGLSRGDIDLIGLHGQTVFHDPAARLTRQLGLGTEVAQQLGIDTVYRFRHADVAAGGQGAPFVPLYHRALAADLPKPLMVLNLGGVANVTWLGRDIDDVIAFDTGPASALIDDFVSKRTGAAFDDGGRLAAAGTVDAAMLGRFLAHPYFRLPAPKSLDRNDFHRLTREIDQLDTVDGAATLTAFSVESIALALEHVPERPQRWLVTGGGRHNRLPPIGALRTAPRPPLQHEGGQHYSVAIYS
eukprot:gene25516-27700_t